MVQLLNILPLKIFVTMSKYYHKLYTFFITLKLGHEVYNRICMETLMSIHIGRVREVFHEKVIFFTLAAPYVTR